MTFAPFLNRERTHSLRDQITRGLAVATVAATLLTGVVGNSAAASGVSGGSLSSNTAAAFSAMRPPTFNQPVESRRPRKPARSENNLSREESEYIEALTDGFEELNDSIDAFYDLLDDPNLGDQQSVNELSAILDTWLTVYGEALYLVPPDGYEEVHDAYLDFTASMAEAAFSLYDGDIVSAYTALENAQEQAEDLIDLVEDATGTSILDQPSG